MELFFKYDLNRLNAYNSVEEINNQIKILEEHKFMAFSFPEVAYFNYAFPTNGLPLEKFDLEYINDFYRSFGLNKYKIIVPPNHDELKKVFSINPNFNLTETIVQTHFPLENKLNFKINSDIEFIRVDETSILKFAKTYLDSFEAVGRDEKRVAKNFASLMERPGVEFYLAVKGKTYMGVNVLYREKNNYLLAGGAVLPEHRNHDHHKSGLTMRLKKCLEDPHVERIASWAYKGGVSLHNMNSLKMVEEKEFEVYEFSN
jgi:hypothetical protein